VERAAINLRVCPTRYSREGTEEGGAENKIWGQRRVHKGGLDPERKKKSHDDGWQEVTVNV